MKNVILIGLLLLAGTARAGAGYAVDAKKTLTQATVSAVSGTTTCINITATTGVSSKSTYVWMSSRTAGFYWDTAYGLTYTASGILGHYEAVSSTAKFIGPFSSGEILLFQSVAGVSGTIYLTFEFQTNSDGR